MAKNSGLKIGTKIEAKNKGLKEVKRGKKQGVENFDKRRGCPVHVAAPDASNVMTTGLKLQGKAGVFVSISLNINIMACKSVLIKCQNVQTFLRRRNSQIKGSRSSIYAAFVEATTVGKRLIAEKIQLQM